MVKGYAKDGKSVRYNLKTSGEPYAITATTDMPSGNQQGRLLQLVIQVVDKNGIPVFSADNEITVTINGPAKLLGLESGSLTSHEDYKSNRRKVLNGKLMAYIQPGSKPGIIGVVIQSPGLKTKNGTN